MKIWTIFNPKIFTLGALLSISMLSFGKEFVAPFIRFALPPGWDCSLEGTEWVCQSDNPKVRREAIIISAAKPKSNEDTLENFFQHLGKTKKKKDLSGNEYETEIKFTKQKQINGVQWVDSLHYGSEIPGFFTRYLATVHKNLAILITYSIAKNRYKDYNQDFNNMIQTLQPIDPKDMDKVEEDGGVFAGDKGNKMNFEAGAGGGKDEGAAEEEESAAPAAATTAKKEKKEGSSDEMTTYMIYGGVALAVLALGFIVLRKRSAGADGEEESESSGGDDGDSDENA